MLCHVILLIQKFFISFTIITKWRMDTKTFSVHWTVKIHCQLIVQFIVAYSQCTAYITCKCKLTNKNFVGFLSCSPNILFISGLMACCYGRYSLEELHLTPELITMRSRIILNLARGYHNLRVARMKCECLG